MGVGSQFYVLGLGSFGSVRPGLEREVYLALQPDRRHPLGLIARIRGASADGRASL